MHVRVTVTRRGRKTYRSVQLVQSYRRPDGMPAHRVLHSFGDLPALATENLKQAIAASRRGESVVIAPKEWATTSLPKVRRNLAYFDVAVCYRTWGAWGLSELIDELASMGRCEVSLGEVVAALTVQRCVAPASKVEASRWYPRTALPELQGIAPGRFNNTRVHRALETLEEIETSLQDQLARRIEARRGQFSCLFLDCTDTWFVGQGPDLASKRVTKEGLMRRQVGIALLCDAQGLPLRWGTIAGSHHEAATMSNVIDQVTEFGWAHQVPLVVDRAMGRGVTVESMLARDVPFVTAAPCSEIASYSHRVPLSAFDGVNVGSEEEPPEQVLTQIEKTATEAGFESIPKGRYVLDLGVFAKGEGDDSPATASWLAPSRAQASLQLARRIRTQLDAAVTYETLADRYGYSVPHLRKWVALLSLHQDVQKRIVAGDADRINFDDLRNIYRKPEHEHVAAFDQICRDAQDRPVQLATGKLARAVEVPLVQLRAVVLFSPKRFVEQRQAATNALSEIQSFVEDLNDRLRSPRSRQSRESATGKVADALKQRSLLDVFDIEVEELELDSRVIPQLKVVRNETVWQRRRRLDGINLIVAHPQLQRSAQELIELYFAKDQVEKDFQDIKSVLALRPVHHRTDSKVRAHVSVCMLALLVQRTIEKQLQDAGTMMTAPAALQQLESGHLNLYAGDRASLYSATEADPEQRRILAALSLEELENDEMIADTLRPR